MKFPQICPIGRLQTYLVKAHIHSRGAHPELEDDPENIIEICPNHHEQSHHGFLALGKGSCGILNRTQAEVRGFFVLEGPENIRAYLQDLRRRRK